MKKPQAQKPNNSKPSTHKAPDIEKAVADKTAAEKTTGNASAKKSTASAPRAGSARPPRHSKSTRKPITIDGEAQATGSKPAAAAKSADAVTSQKATGTAPKNAKQTPSPKVTEKNSSDPKPAAAATPAKASAPSTPPASKPSVAAGGYQKAQAKPSSGIFGKLVAAVIGGLIALGGAGGLQYVGLLGVPGGSAKAIDPNAFASSDLFNSTTTALTDRIASLEGTVATVSETPAAVDASAIKEAVDAAVVVRLAELPSAAGNEDRAQVAGLATSLEAVEAQTQTLSQQASENEKAVSNLSQTLAALKTDMATLSSSISSGAAGEDASLAALDGRLNDLKAQIDGLSAAPADEAIPLESLAGLEAGMTAATQAGASNAEQIANLAKRVQSFETAMAAQAAQSDRLAQIVTDTVRSVAAEPMAQLQAKVDARLTDLDQEVQGQKQAVTSLVEQSQNGADKKAARAIAAAALVNDINRGVPFAASLTVMQQFVDGDELSPLAPYAQTGIITAVGLDTQFGALRGELVTAGMKSEADSPLDRLKTAAWSLVKVQPLNAVEGDDAQAIASRIAAALKTQDLTTADTEWAKLPDASKAVSKDWHAALAARVLADRLLTSSIQSFVMSGEAAPQDG
ncbi:MAG: hypothetical protein AAF035_06125 [Pseudomonadota bacterium]